MKHELACAFRTWHALSVATMAKLDGFYVTGMGTTKVTDDAAADGEATYAKKCYLWPGATVDVCFTNRDDDATTGSFKVGDFEDMLHTVHNNLIVGYPLCGMDKWEDNHYAIDGMNASADTLSAYVTAHNPYPITPNSTWG